jgi:hypothetical protein
VLLENLITSSWSGYWPYGNDEGVEKLRNHPMYTHCFKKIEDRYKNYSNFVKKHPFDRNNASIHFQGIYYYTQIHIAMYNKIMIEFREETRTYLSTYWSSIRQKMYSISPMLSENQVIWNGGGDRKKVKKDEKMTIQMNMKMPWLTGIADVVFLNQSEEVTIIELKASVEADWLDDAITQAMLYAMMTGKTSARLILLNPFRNEKVSYYFNMKKIMDIRDWVMNDIISWNINCYLSKQIKARGKTLEVTNQLFLSISDRQYTLLQFMSPTKIDILSNVYFGEKKIEKEKEEKEKKEKIKEDSKKRAKMTALEKLCADSDVSKKDAIESLVALLKTSAYRDKKVYIHIENIENKNKNKNKKLFSSSNLIEIDELTGLDISEIISGMELEIEKKDKKEKKEDRKEREEKISLEEKLTTGKRTFYADVDNTMISSLVCCSYLAKEYKLV